MQMHAHTIAQNEPTAGGGPVVFARLVTMAARFEESVRGCKQMPKTHRGTVTRIEQRARAPGHDNPQKAPSTTPPTTTQ